MFQTIAIHGGPAELLWGHHPAVVLKSWRIVKAEGRWTLAATVVRVNAFQARQTPLHFAAPRAGGFWMWPIVSLDLGPNQLRATLGPPEQ